MTADSTDTGDQGVAIVTGANGIVGPGICSVLHRAGWRVAACARREEAMGKARSTWQAIHDEPFPAHDYFLADLNDPASCASLIAEVSQRMGAPRLLVNNACSNATPTTLEGMTPEYCAMMTNVNLLSPIQLIRAAAPLLSRTRGSVVNVSSVAVNWLWKGGDMYSVLKAALEQLTRFLAVELGPSGVRINCVRLGLVPGTSPAADAAMQVPQPHRARAFRDMARQMRQKKGVWSVTGEVGAPEDVGEMIAYLASEKARFITGTVIPLDGGLGLMGEPPERTHAPSTENLLRNWHASNQDLA